MDCKINEGGKELPHAEDNVSAAMAPLGSADAPPPFRKRRIDDNQRYGECRSFKL